MHFGLGEHEQEEIVLASPFGGRKMARECRDLVDKVSNGVEGGLYHYFVKWKCLRPSPDHLVMAVTVAVIAAMIASFLH